VSSQTTNSSTTHLINRSKSGRYSEGELEAMPLAELRQLLRESGITCDHCLDKLDYVEVGLERL
jgi:hypothetical protein